MSSRAVVFLDRDGTLNVERGYIKDVENLVLIEGAGQAVLKLNKANISAVLVTNQSGAARNFYPESHIIALHTRLSGLLAQSGAFLDAIYYCPHLPDGSNPLFSYVCNCRKPATGMIDRAFLEHPELNRQKSFVVGDKICDLELAYNSKAKSVLVKTGYGNQTKVELSQGQSVVLGQEADSIVEAVDWIIEDLISS
jgi:D-glycero-D-manno-heptose 1,7-bisphosphate phosphatase